MTTSLRSIAIATAALAVLLSGCSQSNRPTSASQQAAAKAPTIPTGPVTAKAAFAPLYKSALGWSSDVEMIRLAPKEGPGHTHQAGKANVWEASFGSPSKRQFRLYTYSVVNLPPDVHQGITAGLPMVWTGPTRDAMPIDLSIFTVDSDAAYQASAVDAAAWLKKNPDIKLAALDLGSTYKFRAPVWYVSWGDKKNGYIALVDATTGKVYKHK